MTKLTNFVPKGQPHPAKCPRHKAWMRKGQCEMCRLEEDKRKRELEQLTGSNKPEVIIGKI